MQSGSPGERGVHGLYPLPGSSGTAVGLELVRMCAEINYEENTREKGAYFLERVRDLRKRDPRTIRRHGRHKIGTQNGNLPNGRRKPDRELCDRVFAEGMKGDLEIGGKKMGLVPDVGGSYKNVFTLAPAFDRTSAEIDLSCEMFEMFCKRCAPDGVRSGEKFINMKKYFLMPVFLSLAVCAAAQKTEKHPIDAEMDKCPAAAKATMPRAKCYSTASAAWQQSVEIDYRELVSQTDGESKKLLQDEQKTWENYRAAREKYVLAIYGNGRGTGYISTRIIELMKPSKERALELEARFPE